MITFIALMVAVIFGPALLVVIERGLRRRPSPERMDEYFRAMKGMDRYYPQAPGKIGRKDTSHGSSM